MDENRVDEVSRAIAQGASRRTVLRALFGAAAVAAAGQALPASAKSDKITMCKPTGSGYKLTDVNVKQVDKRLQDGYFEPPYSCDEQPSCEPCEGTCLNPGDACGSNADCCSERCLSGGTCGDLCYCHDLYDGSGQACRSGFGWSCPQTGCTSNADCGDGHYCIVNEDPVSCPSPTGICTSDEYDPCDA